MTPTMMVMTIQMTVTMMTTGKRGVEDKMGCDQTETLDGAFVPHCPFSHQRLQCLPPGRIISDSTKSYGVRKNNTKTTGPYHNQKYST